MLKELSERGSDDSQHFPLSLSFEGQMLFFHSRSIWIRLAHVYIMSYALFDEDCHISR